MEFTTNQFNDLMIDGRKSYQLSDGEILKAYHEAPEEMKQRMADLVANRLDHYVPRSGESKDECIGRVLEDFVNGRITSVKSVAERMGRSHRYLQQELFYLCTAYINELAQHCEEGRYDARNEYSCKKAKQIIDSCFEKSYNGTIY